jgi:adenylosuccinate synthase
MDTVIGRYATRINGVTDFVITKLDVLTGFEQVPICVAYDVEGVRTTRCRSTRATSTTPSRSTMNCMDGWWEDISGCRTFEDLPANCSGLCAAGRGAHRRSGVRDRRRPGRHEIIERFPLLDA